MTSKLSWIAFLPLTLMAIAVKVIQLFFLDANGTFMGLNNLTLSYIAIACALVVLLFAVIFCFIDKKMSPVYLLNKNVFAGIIGLFIAVALACDGANQAFAVIRSMNFGVFDIINIVLTILCAIVFVVLGLNHFVGNGGVRGLAIFYLLPALWAALRLVSCFLQFTTISIAVTDVTQLVCYIFITLFLFNYAMIVSLMHGKSPVRAIFIYGMPATLMLLSYSVYQFGMLFKAGLASFDFFSNINTIEFALLGIYMLSIIIEISLFIRRKDEIEIIDEDTEEQEYEDIYNPDSDIVDALSNSVTYGNSPDKPVAVNTDLYTEDHLSIDDEVFIEVAQTSLDQQDEMDELDASDFIYGAVPTDDELILPIDYEDEIEEQPVEEKEEVKQETAEHYITKEQSTFTEEEEPAVEDFDSRMDRIDKLILEISEDEN